MSWKFWFRSGKHSPVIGYIVSWCKLEIHALGEPSDLKCGCMLSLSSKKFYTQRQSKLTLINFAMLNSHITGTYIFKIDQKHLIIAIIKKKNENWPFSSKKLVSKRTLTWELKWSQTGSKYQTILESCSVSMAISLGQLFNS